MYINFDNMRYFQLPIQRSDLDYTMSKYLIIIYFR